MVSACFHGDSCDDDTDWTVHKDVYLSRQTNNVRDRPLRPRLVGFELGRVVCIFT